MGPLRSLLRLFVGGHARRRPARVLLGGSAIAIGVALLVAVESTHGTIVRSLERTADQLAGRARLQVLERGALGVGPEALEELQDLPGLWAAPVVQGSLTLSDLRDGPLLVLGVDPAADARARAYEIRRDALALDLVAAVRAGPRAGVFTRRFAERHGLSTGDEVRFEGPSGIASIVVAGLLEDAGPARAFGGNLLVLPLASAQRLLGRGNRFDRIELVPDGTSVEELRTRAASALGERFEVAELARRGTVVEDALGRVRALVSISAMALLVALFLIYNSVSLSVVERARDIGILRAIGARRVDLERALVLEWALVGLAGSVAGVLAGFGLVLVLSEAAARSANLFATSIDMSRLSFSWSGALAGVVAGTATAAAAAWLPARAATRAEPVDLFREGIYRAERAHHARGAFVAGALLVVAAALVGALGGAGLPPMVWLALGVVVFLAVGLCGPGAAIALAALARPLLQRVLRVEGRLATESAARFPQRTALTVVAFGGAVAMMVASASTVLSFQRGIERWMEEFFPFDLSVQANDLADTLYGSSVYPEEVLDRLRAVPGVRGVAGARAAIQPFGEADVMLTAIELREFLALHAARGTERALGAAADPAVLARLEAGEGVLVSENLAALRGLATGDRIELPTPAGTRALRVEGLLEDYSWPAGSVMIDRGAYARLWGDRGISFCDLTVDPAVPAAEMRARIGEAIRDRGRLFVYSPDDIREVAREALAASMALADTLVLLALGIGFLGVVNTLLISVLLRRREIGLLRAVGATRAQVARSVGTESLMLAAAGTAFGIVAGLVGAAIPLRMMTLGFTGFLVPFEVPWSTILLAAVAGLVLGVAAGWLPARRAARTPIVEALAFE